MCLRNVKGSGTGEPVTHMCLPVGIHTRHVLDDNREIWRRRDAASEDSGSGAGTRPATGDTLTALGVCPE